jgi:hypothetical protein
VIKEPQSSDKSESEPRRIPVDTIGKQIVIATNRKTNCSATFQQRKKSSNPEHSTVIEAGTSSTNTPNILITNTKVLRNTFIEHGGTIRICSKSDTRSSELKISTASPERLIGTSEVDSGPGSSNGQQ